MDSKTSIEFLPAEREGMVKVLFENLASLVIMGSNIEFLKRLVLLKDICDAWKNMNTVSLSITVNEDQELINNMITNHSHEVSSSEIDEDSGFMLESEIKDEREEKITVQKDCIGQPKRSFCCEHCGQLYTTRQMLKRHMSTHEPPTEHYMCSICDREFTRPEGLRRHVLTHTGEKRCICSLCGKQFSRQDHLILHTRTHTGERPYACSECGKRFMSGPHLKKHFRMHTGEKPFKCSQCGRGFSNVETVRKHYETHSTRSPA